ncbi:MAG: hypothetical protein PWP24_467 [Clostridiales bacterium]|nr:hypothetical protein [Clostridiales bacterium]
MIDLMTTDKFMQYLIKYNINLILCQTNLYIDSSRDCCYAKNTCHDFDIFKDDFVYQNNILQYSKVK